MSKIGVIHGISLLKSGHGCNGFSRIKQIRVYPLNLCHLRAICPQLHQIFSVALCVSFVRSV
jgi:hypothetical protein